MMLDIQTLEVIAGLEKHMEQIFFEDPAEPCEHVKNLQRLNPVAFWVRSTAPSKGFRHSSQHQKWKMQIHGFLDPFPEIEHSKLSIY